METETDILRQIIENQEMIIKKLEEKIEIYERHEKEIDMIWKVHHPKATNKEI